MICLCPSWTSWNSAKLHPICSPSRIRFTLTAPISCGIGNSIGGGSIRKKEKEQNWCSEKQRFQLRARARGGPESVTSFSCSFRCSGHRVHQPAMVPAAPLSVNGCARGNYCRRKRCFSLNNSQLHSPPHFTRCERTFRYRGQGASGKRNGGIT